jgi:hypothetical protein
MGLEVPRHRNEVEQERPVYVSEPEEFGVGDDDARMVKLVLFYEYTTSITQL